MTRAMEAGMTGVALLLGLHLFEPVVALAFAAVALVVSIILPFNEGFHGL